MVDINYTFYARCKWNIIGPENCIDFIITT